ncbi:hypothetical protein [Echinicola strongylocentroti]|nr:hypothetical protein [Echinicola strongylocentroti]
MKYCLNLFAIIGMMGLCLGCIDTDQSTDTDDLYIASSIPPDDHPRIIVDSTQKQQVLYMGGDMERSSDHLLRATNPDEILKWTIEDIDFNIFRVRYDKHQELIEGQKNFGFYDNQIQVMKKIREINPQIKFLATMRSDYNGFKTHNHNNLPTFIYNYSCIRENGNRCLESEGDRSFDADKYGVFLADYVEHMYQNDVEIDFIATSKEYQAVVYAHRSHFAYIKMKSELEARSVPVPKLIGPATWGIQAGINFVNGTINNGYANEYEAFSTHDLGHTPHLWGNFVQASNQVNKAAIDDESQYGTGGRTHGEEPEHLGSILYNYGKKTEMYAQGLSGEIFFEVWSRGVGSESRSIYFKNNEAGKRMRSYYVMKDFANSSANNYYCPSIVENAEGLQTMVFRKGNLVHVWIVNNGEELAEELKLYVPGFLINGDVAHKYWQDPTKVLSVDQTTKSNTKKFFKLDVPPASIHYLSIPISKK